ncbi:MAG: exosortase/archaeosortase family protein [Candidatus Bathyarchaeia archaeon]
MSQEKWTTITSALMKLLPFLSFVPPLSILYITDPQSFSIMYPGRTSYLFFLWLALIEMIIFWEKIQAEVKPRKPLFISLGMLPTIYLLVYIAVLRCSGLEEILLISIYPNSPLARQMYLALSLEYIAFAALFAFIVLLTYGTKSMLGFQTPAFFLGAIGLIFLVDWAYPGGKFTPFQALVKPTATLAASVLKIMGYEIKTFKEIVHPTYGPTLYMSVYDPLSGAVAGFGIAWPCAGIESIILYTLTISVFLQTFPASKLRKIAYFMAGLVITYSINILRIVTIFLIALKKGDVWTFHNYYGWLYSVSWIVCYPMIITGVQRLLDKTKTRSTMTENSKVF